MTEDKKQRYLNSEFLKPYAVYLLPSAFYFAPCSIFYFPHSLAQTCSIGIVSQVYNFSDVPFGRYLI